jgi:hypothetical protein
MTGLSKSLKMVVPRTESTSDPDNIVGPQEVMNTINEGYYNAGYAPNGG